LAASNATNVLSDVIARGDHGKFEKKRGCRVPRQTAICFGLAQKISLKDDREQMIQVSEHWLELANVPRLKAINQLALFLTHFHRLSRKHFAVKCIVLDRSWSWEWPVPSELKRLAAECERRAAEFRERARHPCSGRSPVFLELEQHWLHLACICYQTDRSIRALEGNFDAEPWKYSSSSIH
jgi:hypothetical protein